MENQISTPTQQRVQALYRYTNAMESGDTDTIAAILQDATHDSTLERMILEVNEVYQIEDRTVVHPDDIATAQELLFDLFASTDSTASEAAPTLTGPNASELTLASTGPAAPELTPAQAKPARTERQESLQQPIPLQPRLAASRHLPPQKWYSTRIASLIAVALLAVLIIPTVSAFAPQFLALFHPKQFTPVSSDAIQSPQQLVNDLSSFMRGFADVSDTSYLNKAPTLTTSLDRASVESIVKFHIQLPPTLPANVGHIPQYNITPAAQETFTFNAAKARAYLAKTGQSDITIPARLANATFTIGLTPGVIVRYFDHCTQTQDKQQCSGGDPFFISEIPAPAIQATGAASLNDLRAFFLSLPKLPQDIRDLLQHADVDNGIVPVPIPSQVSAQQITIHGSKAIVATISDNGGLIWQTNDILYMIVAAHTNSTQLQTIANSLQ